LVEESVAKAEVREGLVNVFVTGSTAAVSTMEYEPGLIEDLSAALERIAPRGAEYKHHLRWGDDNGRSHIRATIVGPGLTIPVAEGRPLLGTWQQVVLIELDTRPRERSLVSRSVIVNFSTFKSWVEKEPANTGKANSLAHELNCLPLVRWCTEPIRRHEKAQKLPKRPHHASPLRRYVNDRLDLWHFIRLKHLSKSVESGVYGSCLFDLDLQLKGVTILYLRSQFKS
jgi:secondary thiamine-phosphate synthase enzyme